MYGRGKMEVVWSRRLRMPGRNSPFKTSTAGTWSSHDHANPGGNGSGAKARFPWPVRSCQASEPRGWVSRKTHTGQIAAATSQARRGNHARLFACDQAAARRRGPRVRASASREARQRLGGERSARRVPLPDWPVERRASRGGSLHRRRAAGHARRGDQGSRLFRLPWRS